MQAGKAIGGASPRRAPASGERQPSSETAEDADEASCSWWRASLSAAACARSRARSRSIWRSALASAASTCARGAMYSLSGCGIINTQAELARAQPPHVALRAGQRRLYLLQGNGAKPYKTQKPPLGMCRAADTLG